MKFIKNKCFKMLCVKKILKKLQKPKIIFFNFKDGVPYIEENAMIVKNL